MALEPRPVSRVQVGKDKSHTQRSKSRKAMETVKVCSGLLTSDPTQAWRPCSVPLGSHSAFLCLSFLMCNKAIIVPLPSYVSGFQGCPWCLGDTQKGQLMDTSQHSFQSHQQHVGNWGVHAFLAVMTQGVLPPFSGWRPITEVLSCSPHEF